MSDKDKDEKKKEEITDDDLRESRRVRDEARAQVLETAERAGRHLNEAGGMPRSVDLRRRQPAGLARRFIESLSMDERREIMDQLMGELGVKAWRHPFNVVVNGRYHRCTKCGKPVGDEVVLVTERLRTGDHMSVFCDRLCLSTYHKW